MEQLIKYVTDKTGLSHEQAQSAASAVISFLKEKLPAPIAGQIDNYISNHGDKSGGQGNLNNLGKNMGGMFSKL